MINSILRKLRQLVREPVLRKWLVGRLFGKYPGEPVFQAHYPSYLKEALPLTGEKPIWKQGEISSNKPERPIHLPLAGQTLTLQPGQELDIFNNSFSDTETLLSLHRFAWLRILGDTVDPAWVNTIWQAWSYKFGNPDNSWAWHPYTASERAINILQFAIRHGIPSPMGDTLKILSAHGPAIAEKLEYFGDHHTSNHLANNGRGLFILGLVLEMPNCINLGFSILVEEAKRIFMKSGILREGSSHYHLLLAHNYRIALEIARKHLGSATLNLEELEMIVKHIHSPISYLMLPGGMPLVGDISPDIPPAKLLEKFESPADIGPYNAAALISDGWLRFDSDNWSGLWHVPKDGWSHMPGHGHQDCGSFELHYDKIPIFIDPGRGSYGEDGEAALYFSARVHNSLTVDRAEPYPPNKPYFDDNFRRQISGPPPELKLKMNEVHLTFSGYSRLKSVGQLKRIWSFEGDVMSVSEIVNGSGHRIITRTLCTIFETEVVGNEVIMKSDGHTFKLRFEDGEINIESGIRWTAYGEGEPATFIRFEKRVELPWHGLFSLEMV